SKDDGMCAIWIVKTSCFFSSSISAVSQISGYRNTKQLQLRNEKLFRTKVAFYTITNHSSVRIDPTPKTKPIIETYLCQIGTYYEMGRSVKVIKAG
ncbi:MAG: hypothetical protein ACI8RD_009573, partial [Bacillariaceae sp.]